MRWFIFQAFFISNSKFQHIDERGLHGVRFAFPIHAVVSCPSFFFSSPAHLFLPTYNLFKQLRYTALPAILPPLDMWS